MKSKLVYWLTYAGMWLLALLPFRALYILSDGVCFLMRHVVHYRRKVVRKNLKNSFPEKSEAELREIEREFYRYICDYMLEEIKMMRMSFEDLSRRMEYGNTEEYLAMLEKHGGIVVLIPHYANFEWLTAMGAFMKPEDVPLQVYKPMLNKYMDEMFKIIRASFNQRRKTLANALNNAPDIHLSKEVIQESIEELGVPVTIRGEALTLQQFAQLSNIIGSKI